VATDRLVHLEADFSSFFTLQVFDISFGGENTQPLDNVCSSPETTFVLELGGELSWCEHLSLGRLFSNHLDNHIALADYLTT